MLSSDKSNIDDNYFFSELDAGIAAEEISVGKSKKKKNINEILQLEIPETNHVRDVDHALNYGFYNCKLCTKTFKVKRDLQRHHLVHSGKKPFECELCEVAFSRTDKLEEHKRTRKHQQKELGTWIDFESDLRITSSGRYQCLRCDKKIHSQRNFKRHYMKHINQRPYKCSICGNSFVCNTDLMAHKTRHSNKCPHKCKKCNRGFKTKMVLKQHYMQQHS